MFALGLPRIRWDPGTSASPNNGSVPSNATFAPFINLGLRQGTARMNLHIQPKPSRKYVSSIRKRNTRTSAQSSAEILRNLNSSHTRMGEQFLYYRKQSLRSFTLSPTYDVSNLLFISLHKVRSSLLFIRLSADNLFVHQPLSRLPLILGQVAGLIKHSYYFKPISNIIVTIFVTLSATSRQSWYSRNSCTTGTVVFGTHPNLGLEVGYLK